MATPNSLATEPSVTGSLRFLPTSAETPSGRYTLTAPWPISVNGRGLTDLIAEAVDDGLKARETAKGLRDVLLKEIVEVRGG